MFAVGFNSITNEAFQTYVNKRDLISVLTWAQSGEDELIDTLVEAVGNKTPMGRILDAVTWVDFVEEARDLVERDGRFAVRSNEVTFGLGMCKVEAMAALHNEEF